MFATGAQRASANKSAEGKQQVALDSSPATSHAGSSQASSLASPSGDFKRRSGRSFTVSNPNAITAALKIMSSNGNSLAELSEPGSSNSSQHRERIKSKYDRKRKGTTPSLSILPRGQGSSQLITPRNSQQNNTILVVDDNGLNRLVLSKLVRMAGFEVELAKDGQEAVDKWQAHGYVAILMDCVMPVLDGYEATQQIRQREAVRPFQTHVPIIAVTANALKGDRAVCLEAGMDEYVTKPVIKDELMSKLASFGVVPASRETAPKAPGSSPPTLPNASPSDDSVDAEGSSSGRPAWPPKNAYWLVPSNHARRQSVSVEILPHSLSGSSDGDERSVQTQKLAAQRSVLVRAVGNDAAAASSGRRSTISAATEEEVFLQRHHDAYEEVQGRSRLQHHTLMMLHEGS